MNQEQFLSLTRQVLQIIGTMLATYGVGSGGVWEAISGAVIMVAPIVWSYYRHTPQAQVAAVDALAKSPDSPVLGVIVAATPEGRELAAAIPGNETVPAGSPAAEHIATFKSP